jgi:hypothetical protein
MAKLSASHFTNPLRVLVFVVDDCDEQGFCDVAELFGCTNGTSVDVAYP